MRVVDDATFVRGRKNQAEGGPKGLDVEGRSGVLAITLEEQALAFFDLESVVDAGFPDEYDDALVEYELLGLVEAQARTDRAEANEARARAELAEILESTVWRMTAPARRIRTALKARSPVAVAPEIGTCPFLTMHARRAPPSVRGLAAVSSSRPRPALAERRSASRWSSRSRGARPRTSTTSR